MSDEPFEDYEHLGDGRSIVRDEFGKIKKTILSPEVASAMGKTRYTKGVNSDMTALLEEAGYNDSNPAPAWVKTLARGLAQGGSGLATNTKLFLQLSGLAKDNGPAELRRVNEFVVSDGQFYYTRTGLNLEQIKQFLAIVEPFRHLEDDDEQPGWLAAHGFRPESASA